MTCPWRIANLPGIPRVFEFLGRKVKKLVREQKASTKGIQHFTDILSRPIGQDFVELAVNFERVRWSGR